MRIVLIVPGTGDAFYCQNCQRDLGLVAALRRHGHDALVVPLYLPLTAGGRQAGGADVFYGAVSLYLRHQHPRLARVLPAGFWRLLDARPVLHAAARLARSTRASGLGALTVSMLQGEQGRQAAELDRLVTWLASDPAARPDVIVLSNALLLGLGRRLRAELRVPVVCWLQDEHVWVDALPPPEAARTWQVLRERAADASAFLAVSAAYADRMADALGVDRRRIHPVHPGVEPSAYRPADVRRRPRAVGFLSRLAAGEGFDRFVEAFLELRRDPRFADVRLHATGGLSGDRRFLPRQRRRLARAGLAGAAAIAPFAFHRDRAGFLAGLTLLSVPVPGGEAFGTYVIEAMAAGVPVVEPDTGAYPEIFRTAGCGTPSAGADAAGLARTWAALLEDPLRLESEARLGREAVARHFNLDRMAAETAACLSEVTP
jgi:glycosyltransferase involved in cell wall biosynthesis